MRIHTSVTLCAFVGALGLPLTAQSTIRVTAGVGGAEPDGSASSWSLSGDGRFVAFSSQASNLVANDISPAADIFLFDASVATTELLTIRSPGSTGGAVSPDVSDDGNVVVFVADTSDLAPGYTGFADLFVRDRAAGTTTRMTAGWSGISTQPAMTPDGRFVAFTSRAENVLTSSPGEDVFLHDRLLGTFQLVSRNSVGTPGNFVSFRPSISDDGSFVAFDSQASNFLLNDTNAAYDVFAHAVATGVTRRTSISWLGGQLAASSFAASISGDAGLILFENVGNDVTSGDVDAQNDVFVADRATGVPRRASAGPRASGGNGLSDSGQLSRNGRYVAFRSNAPDFGIPDPTPGGPPPFAGPFDVYVKDLETDLVEHVSLGSTGNAQGQVSGPSISADGRFVAFGTSTGLVPGDATGPNIEIYVRDRGVIVYTTPCAGDNMSTPCPCGNPGFPGNGCENYGLTGGVRLSATGSTSVSNDTITLVATGFPIFPTALGFSQGDALQNNGFGVPFGDGVRCIGGNVLRLRQRQTITGETFYGFGVAGDPPVSVQGQVGVAGGTRYYQVSYRSVGSFCFQQKVNWSNSIAIVWAP